MINHRHILQLYNALESAVICYFCRIENEECKNKETVDHQPSKANPSIARSMALSPSPTLRGPYGQ